MSALKDFRQYALLGSLAAAVLMVGCEVSEVDAPNATVTVVDNFDPDKVVCDPFGGTGPGAVDQGLWARLYYLQENQPHYSAVADYLNYGSSPDVDLFFNQLDIPTRAFDLGFMTQSGTTLRNLQGNTLYEWFALHFETEIRLSRLNRAAKYQFAILSDDGAIMQVNENGSGYTQLINNDGFTPTRMRCASRAISLNSASRLPMKLDYFQGPRYHVSLVILWREIVGDEISNPALLSDVACNQSGNSLFFDSTQVPSAPTEMWYGMLDRGWRVLSTDNYYLPAHIRANPCPSS
jgi:hypothetical protein